MIKVTIDTITPKLRKVRTRLPTSVHKILKETLQYGKSQAKMYVKGQPSGDISKGIGYRLFKKKGYGYLFSIASGKKTGFPYNLWVNRTIPITGAWPYFNGTQQIVYGGSYRSPSGKPINWRMTPGYFDLAQKDMARKLKSTSIGARLAQQIFGD